MALSFVEHIGDGETTTFAVPFPYIDRSHVKASSAGLPISFDWLSPNTVQINPAPADDAVVKIYRATPNADRLVDFADDSVIDEALLDLMSVQLFYIAQEAFDLSATSITIVADGNYDARARRVKNVADPVDLTDAVNLKTFQSDFLPRLQAEANRAESAASTSLVLKSDFDAKWAGILQKEQDFNTSYGQIQAWNTQVAANLDAVQQARNAVLTMQMVIEGYKASIEGTRTGFNADTAKALADYNAAVAQAENELGLIADAVAGDRVRAESAAAAAQASALVAAGHAQTTSAKAQEATNAANAARGYKEAVEAVGVDAVALQAAVLAAQAAADRAEAAEGANVTWDVVADKPTTFPPAAHGHTWDEVSGKPTTFPPATHSHDWATIGNKPTTFTPAAHGHAWTEITGKPAFFSGSFADLSNVPTTFAPAAHTHAWTEVTGKPTVFPSDWTQVANKPSTYPPATHNHDGVYIKQSRFTISTSDPSGGVDGDVWFKYSV